MNQKTSLAQFKKNKPKPFYRQYFLFNLGSWFLAISSQFFVILGLCLVIFSSDKQYIIVGTVAIIVGLVIPILLACHLRNKELWPTVLQKDYKLRKRWELIKLLFFIPLIIPLIAALFFTKLLKEAAILVAS